MKRQTLKQRRSLAAKKGWETRKRLSVKAFAEGAALVSSTRVGTTCPKCGEWAPVRYDPTLIAIVTDCPCEQKRAEALNALSNGPPNIERDTDWGETRSTAGTTAPYAGYWPTKYPDPLPPAIEYSTKPTLWARLRKGLGGRA